MTKRISKYILYLFLLSCLWIASCLKNESIDISPTSPISVSQDLVAASIYGKVMDQSDNPIINAEVTYKSGLELVQVYTDEDGYFLLNGISNQGQAAFVSVTSPNRFESFRNIPLVENRNNYTEIKMMDKQIIGNIDASNGGSLSLTEGAEVKLPNNAIVNSAGEIYDGQIAVAMDWIDPSAADLVQQMIGDLSGIDEDGNMQALSTMGMLQVELIAEDGSLLNLREGAMATLTFPIPPSLMSSAAPTIPLWSYNETEGIWMEEGEAYREGDNYIGEVNHFSSWNIDYKFDPIDISGQITCSIESQSNSRSFIGCSYLELYICSDVTGRTGGWLCEDGSFSFLNFPKDEPFDLKVVDSCGDTIFQDTYGPFTENKDLGIILIDDSSNFMKSIKGNAVNCNNDPVSNGYIRISNNQQIDQFPIEEDGTFEISYTPCELNDFVLIVVDNDFAQNSDEFTIDLDNPNLEFNNIKVCNNLDNFIAIDISGLEDVLFVVDNCYLIPEISNDSLSGIHSLMYDHQITKSESTFGALFGIPKNYETNSNFDRNNVQFLDLQLMHDSMSCYKLPQEDITACFKELDISPGSTIKGTFSGFVGCSSPNQADITTRISGSFSVVVK